MCTGIGGGAGTGAGGAATGGSAGTGGGGGSSGGASGSGGGASGSGGGASGSGGGAGSGGSGGSGPSCPTGRTLCGTDCVDTTSNPLHCGGCGRPCGANQVCSGSACQTPPDCRSVACVGFSFCDLATGLCNPGCALDTQCGANETCDITTHACICKTGYHQCSGVCLSNTSVASCGPSCSPCATDPNGVTSCSGTACGLTCNAGYKMCGGVCALCPTANVSASACSGTQCVATTCATGFHLCAGQCSANTSVMSCGTSCTACPTPANGTASCSGTACGITCNTNYRLCNGACAACPTANVTATTCSGASCIALTCTSGGTYHICSGTCVSNTSPLSCGGTSCTACPTIANGMATCNGATCGRLCNTGYALCGNLDVCALCPTPAATTACSGTTCVATSCDSTRHVCSGMCVLKSSVDTCGTSCTPCPAPPANAVASCNGTTCGFKCNTGFAACGSACCTDCRSMSGACTGSDWCSDVSGVCAPVEKLQPNSSSLASLQLFGARVSISGSLAVVGAPDDENNVSQVPLGAVYVFERQSSGTWLMQGSKLLPSPVTEANYGSAVSLSGQRLLVGASRENGQTGAAYIYDRVAGVWTQQVKWVGELSRDMFGVAGSLDGDRAIVGASRNPGVTPTKLGAAYIYERRTDGTWPAAGIKLGASDGFLNDQFGIAVSLSGDRALVGGAARRGAYVFARQSDGSWTEEQILTVTGQTTDQFARAVSLSGDRALVGASQDADRGTNAGAVYVFERQANGTWTQTAKLYAPAPNGQDSFGVSVAQSGDRVLVGADTRGGSLGGGPGAAYLFVHNSDGTWTTPVEVKTAASDVIPLRMFGSDVSLSGDFGLIGALYDVSGRSGVTTGAAYVADMRALLP